MYLILWKALLDHPKYIKALQRRAASNEQINSWSSLTSAQEGVHFCSLQSSSNATSIIDYTVLLELLPPSSPQLVDVKRLLQSIKPRLEQAQKRETSEMLDKLKGIGNSVLGMHEHMFGP